MLVTLSNGTEFNVTDDLTEDSIGFILYAKNIEDKNKKKLNEEIMSLVEQRR